ncbi:MAG: hypothetical protein AAFX56_19980, partial [Pseudomonadota bacterium]
QKGAGFIFKKGPGLFSKRGRVYFQKGAGFIFKKGPGLFLRFLHRKNKPGPFFEPVPFFLIGSAVQPPNSS